MLRCRIFRFLWRWIPAKTIQGLLLRFHADRCRFCQEDLASLEEARKLLWQPEEMKDLEEFWRASGLEAELQVKEVGGRGPAFSLGQLWRSKRLAAALILFFVVALGAYILFRERRFEPPGVKLAPEGTQERFSITHLNSGEEPANPIIFKPFGSHHIFVWVEKNREKEIKEESP